MLVLRCPLRLPRIPSRKLPVSVRARACVVNQQTCIVRSVGSVRSTQHAAQPRADVNTARWLKRCWWSDRWMDASLSITRRRQRHHNQPCQHTHSHKNSFPFPFNSIGAAQQRNVAGWPSAANFIVRSSSPNTAPQCREQIRRRKLSLISSQPVWTGKMQVLLR